MPVPGRGGLFFRCRDEGPLELVRAEPPTRGFLMPGEPVQYFLIVHLGKIDDCLLAGGAKAAVVIGGHLIPMLGAWVVD